MTPICAKMDVAHCLILHIKEVILFLHKVYYAITVGNNKEEAIKSGAVDMLFNLLKIHIYDEEVCANGCNALWIITSGSKYFVIKHLL